MKKKYLLMKILFLLFSSPIIAQGDPVTTIEYQTLVDFYNTMGGDSWTNKWDISNNNLHTVGWYGVKVENGHVVEMNLYGNTMKGTFPSSFGNLKYLRKLDLNSGSYPYYYYPNDLSTADLNNLSGLESLEYLNLNGCKLTGSLPSSLSILTKLKTLNLGGNTLAGAIPNEIGNLTALETIDFSSNKFTSIPVSIGNLTNLKTLTLNNNKISALPKELENLTNLTSLQVSSNEIADTQALLNTSISLSLYTQSLVMDELVYKGVDVVLTNLPHICLYKRATNDFSATNTFIVYIDNANMGTITTKADGSIVIPKSYLVSLTPTKKVSLYQQTGETYNSTINITTITIDLPEVPDLEYQALVDFYNATAGANWTNKWDVSVNNLKNGPWYGLIIEGGHIVEINLYGNTIKGAIPASFSNLKYLRKLELNSGTYPYYYYPNDLSTTDLSNLSGLENLEYLNLNNCKLTGSIPSSWSQFSKLKSLNLAQNTFAGAIFSEIGSLTNLESIDLSSNKFTSIPASISSLTKLKTFNLNTNTIEGAIPSEIGNLTTLETIDFSNNSFTSIPSSISNLTNLKTLTLNNNKISVLPKALESLTSLTSLQASSNEIADTEALLSTSVYLPLNSQKLFIDELVYNGGDVVLTLPHICLYYRYYNNFTALNSFIFYVNNVNVGTVTLRADGTILIPKSYFSSLTSEKKAYLYQQSGDTYASTINFNKITLNLPDVPDLEYQALVDFYNATAGANWTNKWDVSVNNLKNGPWYGLTIENGHIVEINLYGNTIKGAIPASFSNLKYLRKLDLNSGVYPYYYYPNDLSTTNLSNLSGLESLENLNLNNCKLTGSIPSSWGQLTKLKSFNLAQNTLAGAIFSEIGSLIDLESIDLSSNKFTSIPASISNLTKLKTFNLNTNTIEGAIPSEIGDLTALETIDFSQNSFTSIPASISNLTNLKTLTLNNNKITVLPKALESLTSLTSLQASSNEIADTKALLSTSVYLPLNSQKLFIDELVFNGDDVVVTMPHICLYYRYYNNFTALNSFILYVENVNVGTLTMRADGTILIPKGYLSSLSSNKKVYLQQQSGDTYYSTITFNKITLDLPAVPDLEYQALVDFYNATAGANWTNKWDVSTNNLQNGAWYGLTIDKGHIVEINLYGNTIKGAIPASFSNLKYLRKLDLNSGVYPYYYYPNDLSTTNLSNLSGLESLEYLNLNNCKLSGSIPASWGQLTKLKYLHLPQNSMAGAIFSEIGNLIDLETIDFSNNKFSAIPASIGNLTKLKTVNLSYNAVIDIDAAFATLQLTSLNFQYQNIVLESIELGANELNIDLPRSFVVDLNSGVLSFAAKNEFQLWVNGVYKKTAFANDGKLLYTNINLLNLKESDKLRIYQTNGVAAYSNINYGKVAFGKPLVDEEFEILKKIYNSTNGATWTNKWDISINNLNTVSWFGVSIKDGHVISLNLFNNNVSGVIPEEITGLTYLKILLLNNNKIGGSMPTNINLLTNLETLDFSSNLLSGVIPSTISQLQKLKKFAIGNNHFTGTIPSALSDFVALEHLDISSNSFNKVEKKLYYDFSKSYIDLRSQKINYNITLSVSGGQLKVDLDNIAKYDLENNNFDAKNDFSLLVNDVTHTTTTTNDLGEIQFDNVRIGEIPAAAKISIRQTTGTFRNTEFNYLGIEDKSTVPVLEPEYLALKELYNQLKGAQWTNKWDVTTNNLHTSKWFGVTTYDGHVVAINLSSNNLDGIVPDVFNNFPNLNKLNLSFNKLTGIAAVLPSTIDFIFDRQQIENGTIDLNRDTVIKDLSINRYEHAKRGFFNQTYDLRIGSFSKTVNLSLDGIKLMDLMTIWNVPNNQKIELRQISGDAKNSIVNFYLKFNSGDSNIDGKLNVLDIQTTINYIMNNGLSYFNYNATDINNDAKINILDIIAQVNIIQNQPLPASGKMASPTSKKASEVNPKISIENGQLLLDTNGKEIASFEIILKDATKSAIEEVLSPLGFTVAISEKNNQVSIIAYSFNAKLNGKITLANVNQTASTIQSALLSDSKAEEVSVDILNATLDTNNVEVPVTTKAFNYPNPFKEETTIQFLSNADSGVASLNIYNLSGRIVDKITLPTLTSGKNTYLYHRGNLASGIYLYIIYSEDNKVLSKGKMTIE